MGEKIRQFACFEVEGETIEVFDEMLTEMVAQANAQFSDVFVEDIKLATTNVGSGRIRYSGILLLQVAA